MRHYSAFDQVILKFDTILNRLPAFNRKHFENQATNTSDSIVQSNADVSHISKICSLTEAEKRLSVSLMRVNHSGEVCAQALYLGQAWVARSPSLSQALRHAAKEEETHLRWCQERIQTLGGRTSFLNPIWAMGSFGIGMVAGLASDKISLGFLAETEQQVCKHLDVHLQKISPNDISSRAILTQMREDEERHATYAESQGGLPLPLPIRMLMHCTSKMMTFTARYL